MTESLEERLKAMEDRESIRELPLRYCDCVWRKDAEGVAALYTEDGRFDTGQGDAPLESRKAIYDYFAGSFAGPVTPRPFIHNHVFEVDGDSAHGRCSLEVIAGDFTMRGYYEDTYARVDGEWKFRVRKAVMVGTENRADASQG